MPNQVSRAMTWFREFVAAQVRDWRENPVDPCTGLSARQQIILILVMIGLFPAIPAIQRLPVWFQ